MRFLTDQDVYATTVGFLRSLGHDVLTAADVDLSRAEDAMVLKAAHRDGRVFVTRDRDFGGLVFVQHSGGGIVYLRMTPSTLSAVHDELGRVLTLYSEQELRNSFVVVEPARHRIRRPPSGPSLGTGDGA
jgi:predicted nuclease of predicted toxin-antitoxin system